MILRSILGTPSFCEQMTAEDVSHVNTESVNPLV